MSPSPDRQYDIDVPFKTQALPNPLFSALWLFLSICIYHCPVGQWGAASIWWGLGAALIYRYKDKHLQGSLILCPLSKIIVVGSLPITLWGTCYWAGLQYQAWALPYGTDLKSHHNAVGYSHIICAIIVPMDIFFQAGHYCSFQDSHMGNTIGDFSPSTVCIELSRTIKASPQGGSLISL